MIFTSLGKGLELTGQLPKDVPHFLAQYGHTHTAAHSARVAAQAGGLAERFGVSITQAKAAGWLHDVSAVIPNEKRVQVALGYGIEVLPEEEKLPMIGLSIRNFRPASPATFLELLTPMCPCAERRRLSHDA